MRKLSEYDPEDEQNLLVGELRIIRYVDSEGTLNTVDFSQGPGGVELEESEYDNLIKWAEAFSLAEKVAAILAAGDDD